MQTQSPSPNASRQTTEDARYRGPVWTLLILAPVIGEVLSGATRLSFLFVLLPEIMVWGGGALLCRELVRRWRAGALSLLLLGLALSVAEEFIIQQTSIAPLPFLGANAEYARYFGINCLYFLFMLGYESLWVVLVPVQVTELCFPSRRSHPWLRTRAIIVTCTCFLIGSILAWYGWTQQARPNLHAAPYRPPAALILLGLGAIAALVFLAWRLRRIAHPGQSITYRSPNPWLIGIVIFVWTTAWWSLMVLIFSPHPAIPAPLALLGATVWACAGFGLAGYWSTGAGWSDTHRFAAAFSATLSCMLPGYLSLAGWTRPDLIFKIAVNFCAVIGFSLLARNIHKRRSDSAVLNT
jgi:hypothetical protein